MNRPISHVILFLMLCLSTQAAIYTATTGSFTDVSNKYVLTVDNDTIIVPAGNFDWVQGLYVTNKITLQFLGTVISNDVPVGNGGNPVQTQGLISLLSTNTNVLVTVEGLVEVAGTNTASQGTFEKGSIVVALPWGDTNCAILNCAISNVNNTGVYVWGGCPLIAECSFYLNQANVHAIAGDYRGWMGGTWGDSSWTNSVSLGSQLCATVENCNFIGSAAASHIDFLDGFSGFRVTWRHNNHTNGYLTVHGTDSGNGIRGTRSFEIYSNYGTDPGEGEFFEARSGTGVIWGNTLVGYNSAFLMSYYPSSTLYADWGGLTGTNSLNSNAVANASGPSLTGTATTGGIAGVATFTLALSGVTANQYAGWSWIDTSQSTSNPTNASQYFGQSWSNTASTGGSVTFYCLSSGDGQYGLTVNTGDNLIGYQPAFQGLDTTGYGQSGILARNIGTGIPIGTPATNIVETIYGWGNTLGGITASIVAQNGILRSGTNYINGVTKPGYVAAPYPDPRNALAISDSSSLQINGNGTVSVSGNGVITIH